jgi:hypothetical protein
MHGMDTADMAVIIPTLMFRSEHSFTSLVTSFGSSTIDSRTWLPGCSAAMSPQGTRYHIENEKAWSNIVSA